MPGLFTAILSVFCYSFAYVLLHKGQVETEAEDNGLFPVLLVGSITLGIAALVFIVVKYHGFGFVGSLTKEQWQGYGLASLSGLIGTLAGRLVVYAAIRRIGATRGIVVESAEAIVTTVLAVVLLGEVFRTNDFVGVALLAGGISLLVTERTFLKERFLLNQGIVLGLLGAVLQGGGHFLRKVGMSASIVPVIAAALDLMLALLVYVCILWYLGRLRKYFRHYIHNWNPYLVTAGIMSATGVLLFFAAVRAMPVSEAAMIVGVQPILVTVLSKLFFRRLEPITWMTGIYSLLVALGIIMLQT
ncbi:DMT family transporter [Alicyclobacillus sp. SO9]|uniref:DMT family transporter n=1 Tax=Alicyclobacillus sp. SO9 TaxID=2665646 RepID=UPI0018E8C48F|nr:DMT family transporter [Alicyclobacillus sp. SO9]QQE78272.1 DMT family transporter [Alicyclobacillus sp. SO9]